MSTTTLDVNRLATLSDDQLFAKLGQAIKSEGLEMLPDGAEKLEDEAKGRLFFSRCLPIVKELICNQKMSDYLRDEKKRDVVIFVALFVDVISGYFGVSIGTMLLVQVYKIGVDRLCETPDRAAQSG